MDKKKAARFLAWCAAAITALSACAAPATGQPSTSDTMPSMTMPAASATSAAPVAANTVSIQNFAFTPADITISVGTTVTWTNNDQEAHTVTATDHSFGSAPLSPGDNYHFTFTKPGTYHYLCTIHPFMTATVVVNP